jgi:hypothetical protein
VFQILIWLLRFFEIWVLFLGNCTNFRCKFRNRIIETFVLALCHILTHLTLYQIFCHDFVGIDDVLKILKIRHHQVQVENVLWIFQKWDELLNICFIIYQREEWTFKQDVYTLAILYILVWHLLADWLETDVDTLKGANFDGYRTEIFHVNISIWVKSINTKLVIR